MKIKNCPGKLSLFSIQVVCIALGLVVYGGLTFLSEAQGHKSGKGVLKRAPPGGGETCYEINVKGLSDGFTEKKIQIPVRERKYTEEEAKELYDKLSPLLTTEILGDNKALDSVRSSLNLTTSLEEYGLNIRWESEDPEAIDSFGQIYNEDLPDDGKTVWLKAWVGYREHERQYDFKVTLYPPEYSPEEKLTKEFTIWLDSLDKKQQTESVLNLPDVYEGKVLSYSLPEDNDFRMIPVLGILIAVLLQVKGKAGRKEQARKREQKLLFDYSELVAKLLVFIGAGLTVRGAWERIVSGYEESVKQGKSGPRPAFEEMMRTAGQMQSGLSEGRAYNEFGRRCGLQPYVKLSALLEQNRKNGGRQLKSLLELEMVSAFEQRKNLAKKLGDEAGTKLLFPLLMMLGVVMVIIVVPAFLSFY